jgi:hypothetical protein
MLAHDTHIEQGFAMQSITIKCPHCGNEQVQKVSSLVNSGTWSEQSKTKGYLSGFSSGGSVYVGSTQGDSNTVGATELARLLSPPPMPAKPENYLIIPMLFCGIVTIFMILYHNPTDAIYFALGLTLLFIVLSIWWQQTLIQRYKVAYSRWEAVMQLWRRLYHCLKCDSVFEPDTMHYVPSHNINKLLNLSKP